MMLILLSLVACQVMDQPGHAFAPVEVVTSAKPAEEESVTSDKPVEAGFEDPQEELILMGEATTTEPVVEEVQSVEEAAVVPSVEGEPAPAPVTIPAVELTPEPPRQAWKKATVRDGWKPTLVGTVMEGPSPHAILMMPSGEKVVVQAGDMLSEDGVIVMSIGTKFVDLAIVSGAEGRASIQNITLSSQF